MDCFYLLTEREGVQVISSLRIGAHASLCNQSENSALHKWDENDDDHESDRGDSPRCWPCKIQHEGIARPTLRNEEARIVRVVIEK
jgi:hypothetical protein